MCHQVPSVYVQVMWLSNNVSGQIDIFILTHITVTSNLFYSSLMLRSHWSKYVFSRHREKIVWQAGPSYINKKLFPAVGMGKAQGAVIGPI